MFRAALYTVGHVHFPFILQRALQQVLAHFNSSRCLQQVCCALTWQGILAEGSGVHSRGRVCYVLRGWGLGRARVHGHEL